MKNEINRTPEVKKTMINKIRNFAILFVCLMAFSGNVWGATKNGTIEFGNSPNVTINSASVDGDDSQGNTWSISVAGTTSFTQSTNYSQVGSKKSPATSITFSVTLPKVVTITAFSVKFGGFSDTAGDVVLKVTNSSTSAESSIGSGSLNGSNDVTISNSTTAAGDVLTVSLSNIAKGVKCYYISYTCGNTTAYRVDFTATGGTPAHSYLTEGSPNAGVELPNVTINSDLTAIGWGFYGWATAACASETTTAPAIVGKAGDTYYPDAAETLYAVYAKGEFVRITSSDDITSGCKYLITAYYESHNRIMTDSYDYVDIGGGYSDYRMAEAVLDETSTNKYTAAAVNGRWCYTITGSAGAYFIQDVVNATNNYLDTYYTNWYNQSYSSTHSYVISFTSGTCSIKCATGDYPYLVLFAAGGFGTHSDEWASMRLYKAATDPRYSSNPCSNIVTLSKGTEKNCSIALSAAAVETCGGASTRQVTVTVTPNAGYFFNDGDELTFTKTSGEGTTVAATYVSGPTKVGNTYEFVYQFGENNSGSGTFGVTSAKTYTNYRTQCCTRTDLTFGTIASPVTEYVITREDLARADAAVEIVFNYESLNTTTSVDWYKTTRAAKTFPATGATSRTAPGEQLSYMTINTSTKKMSASETGVYTIIIKQDAATISATDYCEQFATVTVTVKTVDKFVDAVNGNNSGEALSLEDVGDGIILPTEETFSINNACHSTTRRLRGWIKASDLMTIYGSPREVGYLNSAAAYEANKSMIVAPGTKEQATGTTWYAVWGEEVTP